MHGSGHSLAIKLITGLPVLILLFCVILFGTGEKFHNTLLNTGEKYWPGYREYRFDPETPTCDIEQLDVDVAAAQKAKEAKGDDGDGASGEGGDDLFDDLFEDDDDDDDDDDDGSSDSIGDDDDDSIPPADTPSPETPSKPDEKPEEDDGDLLDDILEEKDSGASTSATETADATPPVPDGTDPVDDLLGEEEDKSSAVDDLLGEEEGPTETASAVDDLLGEEEDKSSAVDDLLGEEEAPTETASAVDDLLGEEEPASDDDEDDDDEYEEEEDILSDDELDSMLGGNAASDGSDGGSSGNLIDDLFGEEEAGPSLAALQGARDICVQEHADFERINSELAGDSSLRNFRWFETSVASFIEYGVEYIRHFLVLLILFCAFTATLLRGHISLRPIRSVLDDRVSQGAQLLANGFLAASFYELNLVNEQSNVEVAGEAIPVLWTWGFAILAAINVFYLIKPIKDAKPSLGLGKATLAVPLYVVMALISGAYFTFAENHLSGAAIFLGLLTEHALLYIHVGLYVWAGMLLKNTEVSRHAFNIVRPWKLPPEILAWLVVTAAAVPTAYSGASGIFVIAAGAIIYKELRDAGARKQLAAAATAMSGSLGVVLSPCLLVVIVAALNKEVTTDQLFDKAFWVFLLSSTLFLVGCLLVRKTKLTMAKPADALRPSFAAAIPLLPYVVIGMWVIIGFDYALNTSFDEHSAPVVLPVVLLFVLLYDRWAARREWRFAKDDADADKTNETDETDDADDSSDTTEPARVASVRPFGFFGASQEATAEASIHIGALLTLMGLSVVLGGIVERAELMSLLPQEFGSPVITMCILVVILVIIGMSMDPYGAVILVSSSIAGIAYANGIDPVHFWLVVLTAFELGYLTPPVALNHLLTRQVIGEEGDNIDDVEEGATFWARHERILLPVCVMSVALLLVAFVPLFT